MPGREVSAARLTHHGIVPLFDQGDEDGVPYAVYEYLPGGSLERRLAAAPLSEAEAGRVAADVTAALAYAHEQGVTHGSIGAASVMLSADGDAKLAGFAGTGTPADDKRALAALLETLGAIATPASDADATAILTPNPKAGRRPLVLAALAALALLGAGVGAALLATSGESHAGRCHNEVHVRRDLDRVDGGARRSAAAVDDCGGDDEGRRRPHRRPRRPRRRRPRRCRRQSLPRRRSRRRPSRRQMEPPPSDPTEPPPTTEPPPRTRRRHQRRRPRPLRPMPKVGIEPTLPGGNRILRSRATTPLSSLLGRSGRPNQSG